MDPPIDNSMMGDPDTVLWGVPPPIEYAPLPRKKRILWGVPPIENPLKGGQADAVVVMI